MRFGGLANEKCGGQLQDTFYYYYLVPSIMSISAKARNKNC